MKIDFQNSIKRSSFLCFLPDIKIAWINPCSLEVLYFMYFVLLENPIELV